MGNSFALADNSKVPGHKQKINSQKGKPQGQVQHLTFFRERVRGQVILADI
jgi:hypothetical protein